MLDWVKIESQYENDSRIRALLDSFGYAGLGIYLAMRIAIESINKDGIPLKQAMTVCQPLASRKKITKIIDEFGLFCISEFGTITASPLVCTRMDTPTDAPMDTGMDTPMGTSMDTGMDAHMDTRMGTSMDTGMLARDFLKENRKDEKRDCFRKPLLEEVSAYCQERQNGIDPAEFIDFYESKDWMIGKNKMKDWRAAIRTWERKRKAEGSMGTGSRDHIPETHGSASLQRVRVPVPSDPAADIYGKPQSINCQPIPDNAPPKPSPTAQWDFATDSWNDFY